MTDRKGPRQTPRGDALAAATDPGGRGDARLRYRRRGSHCRVLFRNSPISTAEMDISRIGRRLDELRLSGVADLARYLDAHPDETGRLISLLELVDANRAALALCGAGSVEELRATLPALCAGEARAAFTSGLLALAGGATSYSCDTRIKPSPGADTHVRLCCTTLRTRERGSRRAMLTLVDITDRVRIEERLRILRELTNRSAEYLSIIDLATGMFLYANDTFCATTGYGRDELLAMRVGDLDPTVAEPWDPARERAVRAERPVYLREGVIRKKDGATFPVEIGSSVVCPAGKEYMVATARDISDRREAVEETRRLREQLAHFSRVASLGVLAASLAHEINQPLAAIMNNAQAGVKLLERRPPDTDEIRGVLEDIVADNRRASEVIRRIRSMLKRGAREREEIDLGGSIREVVRLVRREAGEKGIQILSEYAPDLRPVWGDGIQIQQVVLNLFLNAFDALEGSAGPRRVVVRAAPEGSGGVRVSVRDSGSGIGAEEMHHIFEPFFSTKPNGLGMGLPINLAIVEAHAGRLWAEHNPDRGMTFHVFLPAAGEERP